LLGMNIMKEPHGGAGGAMVVWAAVGVDVKLLGAEGRRLCIDANINYLDETILDHLDVVAVSIGVYRDIIGMGMEWLVIRTLQYQRQARRISETKYAKIRLMSRSTDNSDGFR